MLHGIAALLAFPLLWLGVATNFGGLAERLSFLPGIEREGGIRSALAAFAFTMVILAVVVGAAVAVSGTGFSTIGGGGSTPPSTPASSPTAPAATPTTTPTATATPIPSPTPTATPTASPTPTTSQTPAAVTFPADKSPDNLTIFEAYLQSQFKDTIRNDNRTGVPVLATEYRTTKDGVRELWLVYWECGRAAYARDQTQAIFNAITDSALTDYESEPDRIRIYSVVPHKTYDDGIFRINTDWPERTINGNMAGEEYTEKVLYSMRNPSENETEMAYRMAIEDSGNQTAHEAFKEDDVLPENVSDRGCPAGVEGVNNDETPY